MLQLFSVVDLIILFTCENNRPSKEDFLTYSLQWLKHSPEGRGGVGELPLSVAFFSGLIPSVVTDSNQSVQGLGKPLLHG